MSTSDFLLQRPVDSIDRLHSAAKPTQRSRLDITPPPSGEYVRKCTAHRCHALRKTIVVLCWLAGLMAPFRSEALTLEDLVFSAYFTVGTEGTPQQFISRNTPQELAEFICKGEIESTYLQRQQWGLPIIEIQLVGYFFDPAFDPGNLGLSSRQLYCQSRYVASNLNRPWDMFTIYAQCRDQSPGSWIPYCRPVATCPVAPLSPLTDPEAMDHESGKYSIRPDMSKVNEPALAGAECIQQKVRALGRTARIASAYRPPAYQTHLREVWDKWKLLEDNADSACAATRKAILEEKKKHKMVFQPGRTSRHSSGSALDIGGVPEDRADAIAASCNMQRAVPGDAPHFEPR